MTPGSMIRTACVVFFAVCVAALPITAITLDQAFLWQAVALNALLVYLAAGLRLTRMKAAAVHTVQVGALVGILLFGALQIRDSNDVQMGLARVARDALAQITSEAPPLTATEPTRLWLLALMGMVMCITDALVTTLAAPAWALAPLVTPFVIASLVSRSTLPWWYAALLGLGYLAVLATDSVNSNESWTRNVNTDSANRNSSQAGVWRMAALIGVPTLALSLAAGLAAPEFGGRRVTSGISGPIVMQDPSINLAKDLNQPENKLVLTYQSSDGLPQYLRFTALTKVSASGWSLDRVNLLSGTLPSVPGVTGSTKKVTTTVSVRDFATEYLPAPYAPQSFSADGEWSYDPASLTVLSMAPNRNAATQGLNYSVTSAQVDPDPAAFAEVGAAIPSLDGERVSAVPPDVPEPIIALAQEITKNAPTAALKANALQAYLTNTNRFHYSTTAPSGSGYDVLENFLFRDRTGFCIHFASAMALMARIVGIPSRVAVGFAPGRKVGDHYEVYAHDMHAWPELYFQSYGWVRFEPTAAVAGTPEWSSSSTTAHPSTSAPTASTTAPSVAPSVSSSPHASATAPSAPSTTATAFPWRLVALTTLWILFAGLVVVSPFLVRLARRARRLNAGGEAHERIQRVWRELHDTRIDLGWSWPEGSPRRVVRQLSEQVDPPTAAALSRIGRWVEWSRFAAGLPGDPPDFGVDVQQIRQAWATQSSGRARFLARWLPRSLFLPIAHGVQAMFRRRN